MKTLKLSLLVLTLSAPPIVACAVAPPLNQSVAIADESTIIIWESATKTEHFIRRASFQTTVKDFGFLVPTPTQPTLTEASDESFNYLAEVTAPRVETRPRPAESPGCGCSASKMANFSAAPGANVQVLEEKRVAGYDAAVLAADDAAALGKWLKDHDYEFSPALAEWVKPYIAKGWKITAFKIAKNAESPTVATSAVRMTFKTDRPFFPYREPQSQTSAKTGPSPLRLLRVYFLSDQKVKGTLGESGQWPGQVAWANRLSPEQRVQLLQHLKMPDDSLPNPSSLTEFEDRSSPRPGTDDVFYTASDDQTPKERPPHIQYVSRSYPTCVMFVALAVYLLVPQLGRMTRRKESKPQD